MKAETPAVRGLENSAAGRVQSDSTADHIEDAEQFFRESFAVLVRGKTVRRHLYFNLPAADRAVRRARARGDYAEMVLVQLVPVDHKLNEPSSADRILRRRADVDDMLRELAQ